MFQQVLAGIRVIDVSSHAFVPVAGGVLSHWGADVIHIENPVAPDPMRLLSGGTTAPGGAYSSFKNYNRGKRAIAIDLASEDGRNIMYRLVENADVFLTSYLPATRKKLKIDVDDIREHNPSIVYAKGTGQGPRGPESRKAWLRRRFVVGSRLTWLFGDADLGCRMADRNGWSRRHDLGNSSRRGHMCGTRTTRADRKRVCRGWITFRDGYLVQPSANFSRCTVGLSGAIRAARAKTGILR